MHCFFKYIPVAAGVIVLAVGCQSSSADNPSGQHAASIPHSQQLIVKFKPHTISCDAAGIARLSLATGVQLAHVRAMSGDACVVMQSGADADALTGGQKILKQHPAIDYVEPDAVMKAS